MANDELLEPLKGYNQKYKDLHRENTEKYFDELVKKAGTDAEANKITVAEYNRLLAEIENVKKKLGNQKFLKGFLIFSMVIVTLALAIVALVSFKSGGASLPIYVGVICAVLAVGAIVGGAFLIAKVLNKKIKSLTAKRDELQAKANEALNKAWAQMASLNALYDWGIPATLVSKTVPIIEMDKNFDPKKFRYLNEKYGLNENTEENKSTYFVQSGSILGNPFLICKTYIQTWFDKTYTGSITIHWTTTVRTSNGGSRTVSHSQTLTASIVRPCPSYNYQTELVYGNDAAPNLTFSRAPSGASGLTEKQIDKMVKKGAKNLDKKAKKAITKNSNYTRLGNDEFEVLFDGTDRDNEVEFRLLYTPLAQKNILDLIKSTEPFGDDFYQEKDKCLNFIASKHSQGFDYTGTPTNFITYDFDAARKFFIDYNVEYFKSFYFDMAPLMAVPLYQQHKSREFIYKEDYPSNITAFEHECVANSFDVNLLKSSYANTPSILKTSFTHKNDKADTVKITAHAFNAQRRVTYITKLGGDGRLHSIPVYWIEYVPVSNDSYMAIEAKDSSRYEFNNMKRNSAFTNVMSRFSKGNAYLYERGLFAALLAREITNDDVLSVNKVYVGAEAIPDTKDILKETADMAMSLLDEQNETNAADSSNIENDSVENILNDDSIDTKEMEVPEATEEELNPKKEESEDDEDED